MLIEHLSTNVWDVFASKGLALCSNRDTLASCAVVGRQRVVSYRKIYLVVLDSEQFLPVLEESHKILCSINFIRGRNPSPGEARADWIFNPKHVGQLGPSPFILLWVLGTWLP